MIRSFAQIAIPLLALTGCVTVSTDHGDLIITNITVIDPVEGATAKRDVIIEGDRITSVRAAHSQPASSLTARIVDGTGKFLIPGLWDMHGHVSDEVSGPLYVLNGVTGVRQMLGHPLSYAWRHKKLEATPRMPRTYLGSALVDAAPAHVPGSIEVGSPEEAREVALTIKNSGAQFLKVYSKLSALSYTALMDEASKLGVRVEGHVPDAVSWQQVASDGKQRSIEHLWGLPRWVATNADDLAQRTAKFYEDVTWGGTLTPEQQLKTIELQNEAYDHYNPNRFRSLVRDLAANRVWQSPTLIVWETRIREADPANASDPRLAYIPAWMRGFWQAKVAVDGNEKPIARALSERRHRFNLDRLREMHASGVPILAGTDSPLPYIFPGWAMHDELLLLVEAGLSPIEALRTSTSNAGTFIGDEHIGRIQEGALADLVILDADPTKDIGATRNIDSVIIGGNLIDKTGRQAEFERLKRVAAAPSVADAMLKAFKENGLDAALSAFAEHCPASVEMYDCSGSNAVEYGLAPALLESAEKSRYEELVSWSQKTFSDQVDVLIWVAIHQKKNSNKEAARSAFQEALKIAPGDPFILHHLRTL